MKVPATWAGLVRKIFPDEQLFQRKVAEFEALEIDNPIRRRGFRSYAPETLPRTKRGVCDFKALWGKAKKALAAMSHQKCSYCEHPISAGRCAAVEHFKNKALFPSLAYDWLNYFLGCFGCNGAKGDRWPSGGGGYIRPDEGDPSTAPLLGRRQCPRGGSWKCRRADDPGLRSGSRMAAELRKRDIAAMLRELEDLLNEPGISPEVRERMARRQYVRVQNPELGYSEALRQCFRRAWAAKFPTASL